MEVRWMVRRDVADIVAIGDGLVKEDELVKMLRQRNRIGMVTEDSTGEIVGFMVYDLHTGCLDCFIIAGNAGAILNMIEKLVAKLSQQRRHRLYVRVPIHDVKTQKKVGNALNNVRSGFHSTERYSVENGDHIEFGFYTLKGEAVPTGVDDDDLFV